MTKDPLPALSKILGISWEPSTDIIEEHVVEKSKDAPLSNNRYVEPLKSGSISTTEEDASRKVLNARKELMEEARVGRKGKLNAAA